ncbi:MAG: Gfo/Idh/MocA family oxidoreductase [Clostridiales bacterium]|jgi:predicted dehydrogenase|nr:Gfo/Idh/MocA family oxidoreductase [Clostridiales bacterium]MDR2751375.1 Gfo/Idh/MocA family oxidoreductase [Clostridiales bacterium]
MPDDVLGQFAPPQEEKEVDTAKKLKFAIIGTGWIAESYIQSIKLMPDIDVVAVADLIPGKAEKFLKRFDAEGPRIYPDHKSLIDNEELDAVCVCTYNTQHAPVAVYALDKGVNVILEKPMTVTVEEAAEVLKAEKRSGKVLSIGFQPRMDENMRQIKRIVESGELGKIYYIQTGGGRRRGIPNSTFIEKKTAGIGAIGDIGCYALDVVLNAIGYPKPLTASGHTSAFFGANPKYNGKDAARFDVDDFACGFVRLEGDIILDFRISWAMNMDTSGDTLILGTEAGLRIPSTECWNGEAGGPLKIYKEVAGRQVEFEIPMFPSGDSFGGLFYKKIRSFADAVKDGGESPVPASQIFYNQAIIDGIVKSAALGREIEIALPEI